MMVSRTETYKHFRRKLSISLEVIKGRLRNVLLADLVSRCDPEWLKAMGAKRKNSQPYFRAPGLLSAQQLTVLFLDLYNNEEHVEKWAFRTLQVVTAQMESYYKDDFLMIKDE